MHENRILPTALLLIFILVFYINGFGFYPIRIGQFLLVTIGTLSIMYTIKNYLNYNTLKIMMVFLLFSILGLVSFLFNGNGDLIEYAWPIAFAGVTLMLLIFTPYPKPFLVMYYSICGFYLFLIIRGMRITDLRYIHGQNFTSVIFLALLTVVYIVLRKNNERFPIIIPFLSLVIAAWAGGRSGVLTFSFIICAMFINTLFRRRVSQKRLIIGITTVLILCMLFVFTSDFAFKNILDIFRSKGLKSPRTNIWRNYLELVFFSPADLLFGPSLRNNIYIFESYSGNLHNAFLQLHSNYGLIALVLFIASLLSKIIKFIINKDYMFFILLVAIIFRISFDIAAVHGILDLPLYYFLFEDLFVTRNKTSERVDNNGKRFSNRG